MNSTVVIGSGELGRAFENKRLGRNVYVFASGVSNSISAEQVNFNREVEMLKVASETIAKNETLIYFSSCFLSAPNKEMTKYYFHKQNMESLVSKLFENYIIFRLPQIFSTYQEGKSTLFNFIAYAIQNEKPFHLNMHAERYVLHTDELVKLVKLFLSTDKYINTVVNLAYPNRIKVSKIVEVLEGIYQKRAVIDIFHDEDYYKIDLSHQTALLKESSLESLFPENYLTYKLTSF